MSKIYCINCVFIYKGNVCEHPDNVIHEPDYYKEKYNYKQSPCVINKDNDCSWFKEFTIVDALRRCFN